ncbi:MAG: response regulator transcription factor [Calditrichia bacterium]
MEKEKSILIIEDDPDIVNVVKIHLKDLGYVLDEAADGFAGIERIRQNRYDLIILDLMLPRMDGFEVCKQIRSIDNYLPILMLTARSEELDRVLGLELGADDYLTKPFSIRELLARIKAIFRRMDVNKDKGEPKNWQVRQYGHLIVDFEKRKVMLDQKSIELTAKEFDLLAQFIRHPGRAYSRQELLDLVWGYQFDGYDHTVNSHINRLRAKIEQDPANPMYIKTVWGIGYRFSDREESDI